MYQAAQILGKVDEQSAYRSHDGLTHQISVVRAVRSSSDVGQMGVETTRVRQRCFDGKSPTEGCGQVSWSS